MHPWIRGWIARSHVERAAFWFGVSAVYAAFAVLATTEGVGYRLRLEPTSDPSLFLAVPVYNPILWIPATFGAGAWGPHAWLNTLYWLTVATLGGVGLARLVRRLPADPRHARAAAPGPDDPGLRRPDAPGEAPRAPARTGSGR